MPDMRSVLVVLAISENPKPTKNPPIVPWTDLTAINTFGSDREKDKMSTPISINKVTQADFRHLMCLTIILMAM